MNAIGPKERFSEPHGPRREARPSCGDCGRPLLAWVRADGSKDATRIAVRGTCFCDRTTRLETLTRILLLQHPREHDVAIGTARMAHRALPNSTLRVGVDFSTDPEVTAALAQSPAPYVLFPGPDALPLERLPRDGAVTLVVLDGTWWQAKKLLRVNPAIARLPRVAFRPLQPSAYAIRREPSEFCVSTIEALAAVLKVLEPDGDRFERLLDPFHAMVQRQQWFAEEVRSSRHHAPRRAAASPGKKLAARLAAQWSRLVCVHGEANAWPRQDRARQEPETVHWIAHRPSTAATFEAVIAPRQPLGPATPEHVELTANRIHAGGTVQSWRDAWAAFSRPDDILVMWGTYYRDLAAADGLPLALPSVNLRDEVSRLMGVRFGTVEGSMAALGAAPTPLNLTGRGGRRLEALVGALDQVRKKYGIAMSTAPTATSMTTLETK